MTILVTGGQGQVATALAEAGGGTVHRVGRPMFDFDREESIAPIFEAVQPWFVINCAAWTAVDVAETEPEAAMRANRDGPATLARVCARAGVPLVHLSTDYVFDGNKGTPYNETDPTLPTCVYGLTKLGGEQAVLEASDLAIVIRTSWVYSSLGRNFVRTMLNASMKTDHVRVVADQKGCPTAAQDLAAVILAICERVREGWRQEYAGVFHSAGNGWTTWHGLAETVFDEARMLGHKTPTIEPIRTQDWPTPARRPPDSRLDCSKLEQVFGVRQPEWRVSVARVVRNLLGSSATRV